MRVFPHAAAGLPPCVRGCATGTIATVRLRPVHALAVTLTVAIGMARSARASPPSEATDASDDDVLEVDGTNDDPDVREIVVETETPDNIVRDASIVDRRRMQERLPRSAPDALRYEPGVYVQQTAHAQASPYVRGVTGQQTLMAFDGIRLNTSTFRQGPNQYFGTGDSRTSRRREGLGGAA